MSLKTYPALDVRCDSTDLLLAMVDDFSPTAVEERDESVRVFFSNAADRDAARITIASRFSAGALDVSDEDWARRSQENLQPITIGRLTIVPNRDSRAPRPESGAPNPESPIPNPERIVIVPSMGFGTGHHATTRLCLEALQAIDLTNRSVLDVGTGSGVLALAAVRLGAARARGIDNDPDAIQAARDNLALNPGTEGVTFELADLESTLTTDRGNIDVIAANLTGALLVRSAEVILDAVRSGGAIVVSGVLADERNAVARAFGAAAIVWERAEDEWVGLMMKKP